MSFQTKNLHNQDDKWSVLFTIVMFLLLLFGMLYAFWEEQRLAEEQGVSVNQIR